VDVPDSTTGVLSITARTAGYKVVSGLAAAGVTVVTARTLGSDGRGAFVLVFTLATITYLLSMLGVNTAARVHLVARESVVESNDYLGLCLGLVVLETVACSLLAAVFLPLVGVHLSTGVLAVAGLLGGSLLAQYTLFDAVNAYGRTDWASALDAAGSVAQIAFVLVLAGLHVGAVGPYLAALTVANGIQVILELVVLRVMRVSIRPRYRRQAWVLLLRSGLPGAGLSLAQLLTFKVDRYLVGLFLTPNAVGLYSVAAAVPEMLRVPCVALSNSFFYRIASGRARPADFTALRRWFTLGAVALSAVAAIGAPWGVRVVFGKEYMGAVTSLRVLLLAEIGVSVFQLDGFILAGLNRIGQAATGAGVGLAVVTLFDLLLIPGFGIVGAAWASVVGYSVMGAVTAVLLRRQPDARVPHPAS
jgi:O-antigen/teichoic acid export membrane protein